MENKKHTWKNIKPTVCYRYRKWKMKKKKVKKKKRKGENKRDNGLGNPLYVLLYSIFVCRIFENAEKTYIQTDSSINCVAGVLIRKDNMCYLQGKRCNSV